MSSTTPAHVIRPASSSEEAGAFWWPLMKELGWNRSQQDAQAYFNATQSTSSWILIEPNSTNKPEGCVVAFIYPNSTGWIGFFILTAAFRGKGLGRELFHAAEISFQKANTEFVGLDAVPEQVGTYQRRGFVDSARIPLMTRKVSAGTPALLGGNKGGKYEILDLKDVAGEKVAKLDVNHTGLDRSQFWSTGLLVNRGDAFGFAAVSGDEVTGFVYARQCEHGTRVGPLHAISSDIATKLLYMVMIDERAQGDFIAETFGSNKDSQKVFEDLGWEYAGISYHRMWLNGKVPNEQSEGGKGLTGMFAIFDAGAG